MHLTNSALISSYCVHIVPSTLAHRLDVNNDGTLDVQDVKVFLKRRSPTLYKIYDDIIQSSKFRIVLTLYQV